MINVKTKTKTAAKSKRIRKASSNKVPRRPVGYFAVSPEEAAEMNMVSDAAALMNARGAKRRLAEAKAKAKANA